jgi:hypothetical protein
LCAGGAMITGQTNHRRWRLDAVTRRRHPREIGTQGNRRRLRARDSRFRENDELELAITWRTTRWTTRSSWRSSPITSDPGAISVPCVLKS